MKSIRKIGSLDKIFAMLPIQNKSKILANVNLDDAQINKVEAIINSMTTEEKLKPFLINGSRKKRIASGSGTTTNDVNRLLKQFAMAQQTLKQFSRHGQKSGPIKGFPFSF